MRLFFFLAFILLAVAGSLVWKRWEERPAATPAPVDAPDSLVGLPDGATMIAAHGTVARGLVDWLAESENDSGTFELGGQEFVGRTANPTPESLGRLTRLVAMLKAYPRVHLLVVGHSSASSDHQQDYALSIARANRVIDLLKQAHISPRRLKAEGRGAQDPLQGTDGSSPRNDRVTLTLTRNP